MEQDSGHLDDVCSSALRLMRSAPGSVTRLRLQQGDAVMEMEWSVEHAVAAAPAGQIAVAQQSGARVAEPEDNVLYVRAPMIGTFYRSAAPGEPSFVQEGDLVEIGTRVGILEAMKLMNPIEADCAGRVAKVLVADGVAVEYDQPLIALYPAGDVAGQD